MFQIVSVFDRIGNPRNVLSARRLVREIVSLVTKLQQTTAQTSGIVMPSIATKAESGLAQQSRLEKGRERPFIVSIEGNIGSGKSTMLNYFDKFTDVELLAEPVKQWTDLKGHNLLHKLYEDPQRWSFQFQSYVQLTRCSNNRSCCFPLKGT